MIIRHRVSNPNSELQHFADLMDRLFFGTLESTPQTQALPIDVLEANGNLVIRAAVPGISPDEINVSIDNNVLTISGESRAQNVGEDAKVYRMENRYGAFTRSIKLSDKLQFDKIDAEFKNGMVTITIPRLAEVKPEPVRVPIRTAQAIEAEAVAEAVEQAE